MDQQRVRKVLEDAHRKGLLHPSSKTESAYSMQVISANHHLFVLERAGKKGLFANQVAAQVGLAVNSTRIILRELRTLGYVKSCRSEGLKDTWTLFHF